MSSESIHEAFARVRKHPDFAGGVIFTREDVAAALIEPAKGWLWGARRPTAEHIAHVTDEMAQLAASAIDRYIFKDPWGWRQAVRQAMSDSWKLEAEILESLKRLKELRPYGDAFPPAVLRTVLAELEREGLIEDAGLIPGGESPGARSLPGDHSVCAQATCINAVVSST